MRLKECRRCHRVGTHRFVPAGGDNHVWECSNDRACARRVVARAKVGET